MFFKGTKRRGVGEISKETKGSGGYLNAHTIYDQTVYFTVLPSSSLAAGIDIQSDAYANSVIDAAELKKELEVIIQEAKRKTDNPSALAVETLYEILHDAHRMRRWRIGHEEGLRALDRDAMMKFYTNFYRPSNTILSIVGDIEPDEAMKQVIDHYGALSDATPVRDSGPVEPHHDDLRYRELSGDISQSQVILGWRTPETMHEDTPALDVGAHILAAGRSSRLYRALRERQLASSVSAYNYSPTELGVFVIHAESEPVHAVDAAAAAWEQVRAIREDAIDPQEIERVHRIFDARWLRRFESMEGQANYLAEWEALGDWQLGDDYYARFMAVTSEDVHRVVQRYLSPDRAGIVIYRPKDTPAIAESASEMVSLLSSSRPEPLDELPPRDPPVVSRPDSPPRLATVEAGVSVFRTDTGMPVLVRPKPGAAIATVALHAVGGVRDENAATAGWTTLAMRSSIKGTSTRTAAQLAEDFEMLGASIGTSVGSETFGWSLSVPVQHLEAAVEILVDIVHEAVIPEEAMDVERSMALADLSAMRDDMFRYPMRLVMSGAYGDHPYAHSPLGNEASLRAASAEDVRQWYRAHLLGSPFVAGVVGDVQPEDAAEIMARLLDGLKHAKQPVLAAPTWPAHEKSCVESRDKAQTALAIAFEGPSREDDRRFAAQLVATIASGLGGRFFDELRDRQSLAYTVHAYTSEHQLGGMFLSYIATSPEKEDLARDGLLREFARLRESEVTEDELARAKRYAIGSHAIRQESGGAILGDILDAWMFGAGLSELAEYDSQISAVTRKDILDLAKEFFDPSRRVEGIVRGVGRVV
jgi:zinc protease